MDFNGDDVAWNPNKLRDKDTNNKNIAREHSHPPSWHLESPSLWTRTFFNMLYGARKDNETTNNFNQRECKLIRLILIMVIHDVVCGLMLSFR